MVLAYVALVSLAWITGNDALSAVCVVVLISVILAPGLRRRTRGPWLLWLALVGGVIALTSQGHGRLALDLVPLLINLALGILFGYSLTGRHTPLIARAIIAIEGRERLLLPRVSGYARALTVAWTAVFVVQAAIFALVLVWWLPRMPVDDPVHAWLIWYLHVGGYLLPALFMFVEYAFRRWYLRHVPHVPLQVFLQRLIRNWPQLLRDSDLAVETGTRNGG